MPAASIPPRDQSEQQTGRCLPHLPEGAVYAGSRQDKGGTKKCLEAPDTLDTDSSLMAAPLTDLCSGESQEEEGICGVSREKVSLFFSVLPLIRIPVPSKPLFLVLSALTAPFVPSICSYSSPQLLSSKVAESGSRLPPLTPSMVRGWVQKLHSAVTSWLGLALRTSSYLDGEL